MYLDFIDEKFKNFKLIEGTTSMEIENDRYKSKKEYYQLKAEKSKNKKLIME